MVPEPEQVLSFEWRIMAIVLAALMMVEAVTLLVNILMGTGKAVGS